MMAGEFRHGTSTPTFLITPRRSTCGRRQARHRLRHRSGRRCGHVRPCARHGGAGAVTRGRPSPRRRHRADVARGGTRHGHVRGLGVALGAITRNTVVAIIGAVAWVFFIEAGLLVAAVPSIGKWLPTGAGIALTHTGKGQELLAPAVAASVAGGVDGDVQRSGGASDAASRRLTLSLTALRGHAPRPTRDQRRGGPLDCGPPRSRGRSASIAPARSPSASRARPCTRRSSGRRRPSSLSSRPSVA